MTGLEILRRVPVILAFGPLLFSAVVQAQITTPVVSVQDSASDSATLPLVQVQGGSLSSTRGIEVDGHATGTLGTAPTFPYITSPGFGGLSLIQLDKSLSSVGVSSPFLSLCAQQVISSTPTPECWYFQVAGGNGNNVPDVLILNRTSAQPNVTLQVPGALNFAAGDSSHGGQLTISGVPTNVPDLTTKPVTVVGGFTSDSTSAAKAAALQLFPGFLNASPPSSVATALEGPLQIGMAVKGNGTQGLLACYGSTSQTAVSCSGATAPLLGVYFTVGNGSTNGSNGVITPPGRSAVTSFASGVWTAGTPVCRDPDTSMAHQGLALIEASNAPCPIGQAVGVAIGDPSGTTTSHVVDLDFSDQGISSSGNSTTYATTASSVATAAVGTVICSDGSGNLTTSNCATVSTTGQGWMILPVISYSPVAGAAAALVAGTNNVRVLQLVVATKIVIGHADIDVTGLSASTGQSMTFGLYDASGNKVFDAGTFDCSSGGTIGAKQNTASATILPGVYYYAWGSTATDCTANSIPGSPAVQGLFGLGGAKRYGTVTGAVLSSGVLPATITLTNISNTGTPIPLTLIEP